MDIRLRKVGNSFVVTVPSEVVERLKVREGDRLTLTNTANGFSYEQKKKPVTVDWVKYTNYNETERALNPVDFIREMRENDRL